MLNFKILNTCMINVHVLYSMFLERKNMNDQSIQMRFHTIKQYRH